MIFIINRSSTGNISVSTVQSVKGEKSEVKSSFYLWNRVVDVADVSEHLSLLRDGAQPIRIPMAEGIHGDSGGQVQILSPFDIVQFTPFTTGQHHRRPRVRPHDEFLLVGDYFRAPLPLERRSPVGIRRAHVHVEARRGRGEVIRGFEG